MLRCSLLAVDWLCVCKGPSLCFPLLGGAGQRFRCCKTDVKSSVLLRARCASFRRWLIPDVRRQFLRIDAQTRIG